MDPSKPISSITRDKNGMFSNNSISRTYSVESLSKGLQKKHKNQSNDYLKSLEQMDNVLVPPKTISQSASQTNIPLKLIHRDSSGMFINKTPIEPTPPEIEPTIPLSRSSSRSLASSHNASARLSRRESRIAQSQDSIDRAGFKFNSSDSFLPDWSDPALLESRANSEAQLPKRIHSATTVEEGDRKSVAASQDEIDEKLSGFVTDVSIARPSSRNSVTSRVSFQLPSPDEFLNSKEGIEEVLRPPIIPRTSVAQSSRGSRSASVSSSKPPEKVQSSLERLFTALDANDDSTNGSLHNDTVVKQEFESVSLQRQSSIKSETKQVSQQHTENADVDSFSQKPPSRRSSLRRLSRTSQRLQNDKDITIESVSHLQLATIPSGSINNLANPSDASPLLESPKKKKSKKKSEKDPNTNESGSEQLSDSAMKKKIRKQRKEKEKQQLREHLHHLTEDEGLIPRIDDMGPPKPSKEKKRRKRESGVKDMKSPPTSEPPPAPPTLKTLVEILFESLGHDATYYQDSTIAVSVEKSDSLQSSLHLKHPFVQIHLVDMSTGQYLLKTDSLRQVTYFNEPNSINYILPTVTKDFDLKANATKIPQWNDTILLNEHYLHLLQPTTLVLFEILDVYTSLKQVQR
jgi:hypothetical protein